MRRRSLLAGLAALSLAGCGDPAGAPGPLPGLTVQDIDGRVSVWTTDGRRHVLLNIWAPWCAPCVEEMPSLDRLDQALDELAVVGLAPGENLLLADEFLRKHRIGFPTYYDFQEQIESVLNISEYPSSLLLSPRGRLLAVIVGPREWDSPDQQAWLRQRMSRHEPG